MEIINLRVNHLTNPIGYELSHPMFSWEYLGEPEEILTAVKIEIAKDPLFRELIYKNNKQEEVKASGFEPELTWEACTRYYWRILIQWKDPEEKQCESKSAYFETGKCGEDWSAKWLEIPGENVSAEPILRKKFHLKEKPESARAYMIGLGLYEGYLNGNRINDGYLQPGFHNYKLWKQYQSFDITEQMKAGENILAVMLGSGWYKGRFGIGGGQENNFGKDYGFLCEIHVRYADCTEETITSDETFLYENGPILASNIYDGEVFDGNAISKEWMEAEYDDSSWKSPKTTTVPKITERYSKPVVIKGRLKPQKVLRSPRGYTILDLGQNITGWMTFHDTGKKGEKIVLKHVEHMQDGAISQDNLKGAKQEFVYISDGKGSWIRPHFTYFGFRYVQIESERPVDPENFEAWSLYTDIETTGEITTGNEKVNRLIKNIVWSQRDNFLEHPTDCPQRSERLGWTGDAQIYGKSACYNMDCLAFWRKYIKDVNEEQKIRGGKVPFIIPKIAGRGHEGGEETSAAWSDVAVIVPWQMYLSYGSKQILREEYPGMKSWIDYVIQKDQENGDKKLWQTGFHFGDWLALDNPEPGAFGKTDPYFISSCYYYYSMNIVAKAANVLGEIEDARYYSQRAEEVRDAVRREYFDEEMICKIDTQTAYAVSIYMNIVTGSEIQKNGKKLVYKIEENKGYLDTGFVGTPYLCPALTKAGYHHEAVKLLLNEGCPGWLYQVNCGATTIWENWDALDRNGHLQRDSSLNHYAFGSIIEWLYTDVCGMKEIEEKPGLTQILIAPHTDERLKTAEVLLHTSVGTYKVRWRREKNRVKLEAEIPYAGSALVQLENGAPETEIKRGKYQFEYDIEMED